MRSAKTLWFAATAFIAVIYGYFLVSRNREHRVDDFNVREQTLLVGLAIFGIVVPYASYGGSRGLIFPALVLYGAAAAILYTAMSALGKHFSPTLQLSTEHRLLTTGIYGWVRHPMYTAGLLMLLAQALLLPSTLGWLSATVAASLLLFVRVPAEERMMRAEFGDQYDRYAAHVGGVIPFL